MDAGAAAAEARAGQLVLVHVDADRRTQAVAAARTAFAGPVEAALPGVRFAL
jgi:ribonuclease BN (tRNA processing enzyme)